MPIVTLTTDLGLQDHYVAAVKARLLRHFPEFTVIDISHIIPRYDIGAAAFVLTNVWRDFPEGSIHIVGVKSQQTDVMAYVALEHEGHFFIGTDNGLFSLLFGTAHPNRIFTIDLQPDSAFDTFPTRDIFPLAAAHLAKGGSMEFLGRKVDQLLPGSQFEPIPHDDMIRARAMYIDRFGNIITNITFDLFKRIRRNRWFKIRFRDPNFEITRLSQRYGDVEEGDAVALFGSSGYLEIAINEGVANQLLGISIGETVTVEFYDD